MDFSTLGSWIAVAAAVSALMRPLGMLIALRGTKPGERPEILRAMNARGEGSSPPPVESSATKHPVDEGEGHAQGDSRTVDDSGP